jgi:HEAT repeat protein
LAYTSPVGLKDLFTAEGRAEAKLKRNLAKVLDKHAQSYDRVKAIETLRDIGSDEAIHGLLRRFNMRYDKSIEDEQEKDYVFEIVSSMGSKAVPALRKYLKEAESIAWGLKILGQVAQGEPLWEVLNDLLKRIEPGYERDPTRKIQLLTFLRDLKDPRSGEVAAPFLELDVDEGVRFTAVEVLTHHGDERAPLHLSRAIVKKDQSIRIRKHATEGLIERGWPLPSETEHPELAQLAACLPPGYGIDKKSGKLIRTG